MPFRISRKQCELAASQVSATVVAAIALVLFLAIFSHPSSLHAAESSVEHRVLLIYGTTDVGEWEQAFNSAILRELAIGTSYELIPEFLNLVGASASEQELMARSLLLQYDGRQIDLIIAMMPESGTFVREWSSVFAPNAKRLYVLPGTDILSVADNLPDTDYLLRSAVEIAAQLTLETMVQLLPELTHIYVVGGLGSGDLSYANRIASAAQRSSINITPEFIQGLLPEELIEKLREIPDTSAILMSTYDADRLGQPQRTTNINDLLDGNIAAPMFAMFDSQLGNGTVGGNLSSSTQYAIGSAALARQILSGENVPRISDAPTQYIFDAERLEAFNLNRNLLPAESVFINDEPGFVEENLHWLVATFMIIIAQLVLIALLWRANNQRRQTEEALKTTQKMEALGSLAGGIAHDFNNILMAIMANAELAKSVLDNPDKANSRLGNIISASNRAKGLISQILLFSRQAATQSFDTIKVATLLGESVEQIRAFLPNECELELHCEDNLPPISVDANQLHQAVMNICINAQHAMNNKGLIRVHARYESIAEDKKIFREDIPPGHYVAIEIQDNGIGIDDENQRHIFEPFFTTKPQGKGTGLGLALVYRIIRAHEGYIDLNSCLGEGTTFTIYLPTTEQPSVKPPAATSSNTLAGHGELILLVDDDDMVLDATARMLERLNYQVQPFRSSLKALAAFRDDPHKWDLVFTDLSMPEMDGARLGAQIRQIRGDIEIILYTGYLDAVDAIDLENLRILSKPSRLEEIANAVAFSLARSH